MQIASGVERSNRVARPRGATTRVRTGSLNAAVCEPSRAPLAGRRLLTQQSVQLADRLRGVAEVDRMQSQLPCRRHVRLGVVHEGKLPRPEPEAFQRPGVDLPLRLAHPDERRVDDILEYLVDRQLRAPQRLPL